MKLEKPKDNSLWFPRRTAFVRVSKDIMHSLKDHWVDSDSFLHPLLNNSTIYYNDKALREYVLSLTVIEMNSGLITFIANQTKDDSSQEIFQRISLNRRNTPPLLPSRPDLTLTLAQQILEQLPLGKIEIHPPIS